MKIEIGKRYVLRDGRITQPMAHSNNSCREAYPFATKAGTAKQHLVDMPIMSWTNTGDFWGNYQESPADIVAEYQEPAPTKAKIPAEIEAHVYKQLETFGLDSVYTVGLLTMLKEVYGLEAQTKPVSYFLTPIK